MPERRTGGTSGQSVTASPTPDETGETLGPRERAEAALRLIGLDQVLSAEEFERQVDRTCASDSASTTATTPTRTMGFSALGDLTAGLEAKLSRRLAELSDVPVTPSYRCETCEDTAFVLVGFKDVRACPDCPPEVRLRYFTGIPPHAIRSSHEFEARTDATLRALESVSVWASEGYATKRWLVLSGPTGAGKTHLALAAGRELCLAGQPTHFTTSAALLDDLKRSFDGDEAAEARVSKAFTVPVLILDDLGSEYATAWSQSEVRRLLHDRYDRGAITIITTNASMGELAARQDDDHGRLISRLADRGRSLVVRIEAEDYRQRRTT